MVIIDPCVDVTEDSLRARLGAKWHKFGDEALGAWVADMDFTLAPPVRDAVISAAQRSALGYDRSEDLEDFYRAASAWLGARHGWAPDPAWMVTLADLVQGLLWAVYAFTEPGDGVIVQGPIYPPFLSTVETAGRRIVDNPLIDPSGTAELDLDGLRRLAADPRTRLLLLCNPHNPTGRVLRRDELDAIAAVAVEHDLVVVSDEVWMDIVYPGHRHVPFATLGPAAAARTVTLTSTSKTFSIAGLRSALAIFGSDALRARYDFLPARLRGAPGTLGTRASIAGWTEGGPWLDAVMRQLDANRSTVAAFVRERLPGVRHRTPDGTYLAWLDFGALDLDTRAAAFLLSRAHVGCNDGADFGGYGHCARLNFATTPAILERILERMAAALASAAR